MKKNLLLIGSIFCFVFSSCSSKVSEEEEKKSGLSGTFTFNEAFDAKFKKEIQIDEDVNHYLYCHLYPQRDMEVGGENDKILYQLDQRLKLNRDSTYRYEYSIIIGSSGDWGNPEILKILVDITGTFTYKVIDEEKKSYAVYLNSPTGGTEERYGATLYNPAVLRSWGMHSSPDYVLDFSTLSKLENYNYDPYVAGHWVYAKKAITEEESNLLEDNRYFPYILDDLGPFCTY